MSKLTVGQPAPNFTLPGTQGEFSLNEQRGKNIVLYFYSRDNTTGCTNEAVDFSQYLDQFQQADTLVIGVSKDSLTSHEKFTAKYSLSFPLLSDPDLVVLQQYGVYQEKKMYGKVSMGVVRTTFVIDKVGIIQEIFNNVKVKGHVEKVVRFVQENLA